MLIVILFVFLIILMFGGGVGYGRYGLYSWSPFALLLLLVFILFASGNLR